MEASDTVEKVDGAEADVVTDAAAQGAGAPAGGGETVDVQGAPETEPDPEAGARPELEAKVAGLEKELEELRGKFAADDVMRAARRSGIFPELMGADEIKLVDKAETLAEQVERLEAMVDDYPDGYEDASGKLVTPQEMKKWLRSARKDLREIEPQALRLREEKGKELRELLDLGRKARKAGWTGEAPKQVKVTPKAGAPKPVVTQPGAPRRPSTAAPKEGVGSFAEVKSAGDFVRLMAAKYKDKSGGA